MPWIGKRQKDDKIRSRDLLRNNGAKLTDDDLAKLAIIDGRRDQLLGKIQERYGIAKEEADKQVRTWESTRVDEPWDCPVGGEAQGQLNTSAGFSFERSRELFLGSAAFGQHLIGKLLRLMVPVVVRRRKK